MTNRTATWVGLALPLLGFFALSGLYVWAATASAPTLPNPRAAECTNPPIELRLRVLRLDNGDAFFGRAPNS